MDKMKMQMANKADENYRKLAEQFPNAVTETIDENGEVVRAVAKEQPYYAVFRDSGMASDSVLTNFDQIFTTISPSTLREVL